MGLACFEPSVELAEAGVVMPEAVIEPDEWDCVVVLVENHGTGPVMLEKGQVLQVQEVKLCQL